VGDVMFTDTTSIPTQYVKTLLHLAQEQGVDTEALKKQLHISNAELKETLHFSAIKYGQLYQSVMLSMQDEFFGMYSNYKVKAGTFKLLCLAVIMSKDLREAIIRVAQFCDACLGMNVKGYLTENNGNAYINMIPDSNLSTIEFDEIKASASPLHIRTSLTIWHKFNCWLIGYKIPLQSINFSFPNQSDMTALVECYPAQCKFEQMYDGFEFPACYLDYPIVQNQETLDGFLRTAPYGLVVNDSIQTNLTSKVQSILTKEVGRIMPGAKEVASQLNLSTTTLRRRLHNEGASFQKLKDRCRKEAAIQYLNCPELTNDKIAQRLGFDESSAFFRAFKRWTGVTPGEYRDRLYDS
jgi:AraC-like DNA-binding protein